MPFKSLAANRRGTALAVLLTAAFMTILDVFIVFVATPSMTADLHASAAEIEWVVAAYGLAYALGLITGGRLGDLLGRRRLFRAGLAVFALASALCGAAPGATALIAARVLQGLGAAAMVPQVLSIIQVELAPAERGRALAIMGAVQGVASVSGQIVGGALIQLDVLGLGWRTVFLLNVPIGLAGLLLAGRFVPESRAEHARRLDLGGVALALAALAAVTVPLVEGRTAGWPWWTFASLGAAIPLGAAFVAWERGVTARGGSPLVELSMFRLRPFRLGVPLALIVYTGLPSLFLAIALYLQDGLGLGPLAAGVAFAPLAVAFVAGSLGGARLPLAVRERLLAPGAATVGLGVASLAAVAATAGDAPPLALALPMAAIGAGQGIVIPGLNGTVLAEVPTEAAGSASGVLATAQQVGGALGVALGGTLFFGVLGGAGAYGDALAATAAFVAAGATVTAILLSRLTRAVGPDPSAAAGRAGSAARGRRAPAAPSSSRR